MTTQLHDDAPPLVVDLDGSLIKTDLLYESLISAFFLKPWIIILLPLWLAKGVAHLKRKLAENSDIDIKNLPWNQNLVDYLYQQHATGRSISLCTGSWQTLANEIATHFSFFSKVYATDGKINLTGTNKAKLLVDEYGSEKFVYIGNENKDIDVWRHSYAAIVVGQSKRFVEKVSAICEIEKQIPKAKSLSPIPILKQARVHQWVKNTLIFVPLLVSHQGYDLALALNTMLAFLAYSFCASATYIFNDLADLNSDRRHKKKRFRPLASGDLSIREGCILSAMLVVASGVLALQLPHWFIFSLLTYFIITVSYSFKLKRLQTIDITVLASLYTLRIISGAAAISLWPSFWLLAFSMFLFLCLATVKRLSEIINKRGNDASNIKISGRGYFISDLPILTSLATSSGILSIHVFAMYINSPEVSTLYSSPFVLWLICPLFGYWIVRMLIMASRGEIDEDPIVFTIKDIRSWITGAIILVIISFSDLKL